MIGSTSCPNQNAGLKSGRPLCRPKLVRALFSSILHYSWGGWQIAATAWSTPPHRLRDRRSVRRHPRCRALPENWQAHLHLAAKRPDLPAHRVKHLDFAGIGKSVHDRVFEGRSVSVRKATIRCASEQAVHVEFGEARAIPSTAAPVRPRVGGADAPPLSTRICAAISASSARHRASNMTQSSLPPSSPVPLRAGGDCPNRRRESADKASMTSSDASAGVDIHRGFGLDVGIARRRQATEGAKSSRRYPLRRTRKDSLCVANGSGTFPATISDSETDRS